MSQKHLEHLRREFDRNHHFVDRYLNLIQRKYLVHDTACVAIIQTAVAMVLAYRRRLRTFSELMSVHS